MQLPGVDSEEEDYVSQSSSNDDDVDEEDIIQDNHRGHNLIPL